MSALLLFGKPETIGSALPHYKIDALLRVRDIDRYDDRINIRCNLIEAYDLLMQFVAKHLPDKFFLEGDQRISLRDTIFREVYPVRYS
jgi:ATP-dependent DNA helicase RecG